MGSVAESIHQRVNALTNYGYLTLASKGDPTPCFVKGHENVISFLVHLVEIYEAGSRELIDAMSTFLWISPTFKAYTSVKVAQFSISHGAELNWSSRSIGHQKIHPPLIQAILFENKDIVQLLINSNVDLSMVVDVPLFKGDHMSIRKKKLLPIEYAREFRIVNEEILQLLEDGLKQKTTLF